MLILILVLSEISNFGDTNTSIIGWNSTLSELMLVSQLRLTDTDNDLSVVEKCERIMVVDGEEVPNVSIYYFDSENFVPIMVHEEVMSGPGKGMIMESKMSDYQEVEGLYFPFSMTQGVKDQPGQPITIESIELNPSIDDSEFNFPESTEEENN